MRHFKNMWFAGAGDHSKKNMDLLHQLLDDALTELSGLQQPGHAESKEQQEADDKHTEKSKQKIEEILKDINCALTGADNPLAIPDHTIETLKFYADPDTYFAIAFLPDPPCGEFINDFDELRKPGALARKTLKRLSKESQ